MKKPQVTIQGRHVVIRLTPNQASALFSLVAQANADGDHEAWLRSAGAPAADIRATRQCMAIVHEGALIGASLSSLCPSRGGQREPMAPSKPSTKYEV